VRTQIYEGLLWQQVIAERKLKPGDKLPTGTLFGAANRG
jgi:hypothetical protein